jgi:thiol:disulfide interchange protein
MAEGEKDRTRSLKDKLPRFRSEFIWYGLVGVAVVGFFVWTLAEMGSQSTGATLVRLLLGVFVVLGGGAALAYFLNRSRKTPFHEDRE